MESNKLDGFLFQQMLTAGFNNLTKHYEEINDLNVFPVPDGDTGTNMRLTYMNGLSQIKEDKDVCNVIKDFANGMLLGARGNSGVLSSRYFFGLKESFQGKCEITVKDFAKAMIKGYQVAYKAVDTPTEGTILTVAREGIDNIYNAIDFDNISFASFLYEVIEAMTISLDNTPNLLPLLKESGVIDSGGKGLLVIFEGFYQFFSGEDKEVLVEHSEHNSLLPHYDFSLFTKDSILEYGYCTEFLLQLQTSKCDVDHFDLDSFIAFLHANGDSIVCFENGTIIKVHIHTKKPYVIIEFAQRYGEFLTFKMENMTLQNKNVKAKKETKKTPKKKYGIVSIAKGEGIISLFKDLGSDVVIDGSTYMNTSSEEIIQACEQINCEEIILLPNETNILMAANQASEMYTKAKIKVLPTKDIPSGYVSLSMLMGDEETADQCYESMADALKYLTTGFICKASRDTCVDGVTCVHDQYIQSYNHHLVGCQTTLIDAVKNLLKNIPDLSSKEGLFFFYGKDVSEEQVEEITSILNEEYPNLEVGAIDGKQDLYDILLGVN